MNQTRERLIYFQQVEAKMAFYERIKISVPTHVAIVQSDSLACRSASDIARFVNALRETIAASIEAGVSCLSLLVSRVNDDLAVGVVKALAQYVKMERRAFAQRGVRAMMMGELLAAHAPLRHAIKDAARDKLSREILRVNLALNYTGRAELVAAARKLAMETAQGKLQATEIDQQCLSRRIYSRDLPPVDLLIHTAGVTTLTDFLLWKAAYAELLFMSASWLDFRAHHLQLALADYAERRRTFGAAPL